MLAPTTIALPSAGPSLLRVLGALALVLGLFLGGAWFLRNGRRLALSRGKAARLRVLESRSLGGRHGVFVVGYDEQRFLLASSPAGIQLLSHLPSNSLEEQEASGNAAAIPFAQTLARILKRSAGSGARGGGPPA